MSRKSQARTWVQGYSATGAGVVIAAIVPGSTAVALIGLEATMYFHIAKIYGRSITKRDALQAVGNGFLAKALGTTIAAKVLALEALNFVPLAGWAVKAPVAYSIIAALGEAIIDQFEYP